MSFFEELRRRNVFRVAAAYLVVGWLLTEVLTTILPTLGPGLGSEARLFYYSTEGRRAPGGAELHAQMVRLGVPHEFLFEPKRPHRWDSGWLERAVEFLARD